MIKIHIPLEGLKISTNKFYAGLHWSKRKEVKDGFLDLAGSFCRGIPKIESYPVEIEYKFFFRSRPLDSLNTSIMAKILEDAFRAIGILEEDDAAHVKRSILEVNILPKKKRKAPEDEQREKINPKDKGDFVEIIIKSYEPKEKSN